MVLRVRDMFRVKVRVRVRVRVRFWVRVRVRVRVRFCVRVRVRAVLFNDLYIINEINCFYRCFYL